MNQENAVARVKPEQQTLAMNTRGVSLRSLDDVWRLAQWIAESPFSTKSLHDPKSIAVAIMAGMPLGLDPFTSVQGISVINGKPALYGDTLLAVCQNSGRFDHQRFEECYEGQNGTDEYAAVCKVARVGGNQIARSFSVAQATRAGLWGKSGPWTQYPARMLQMRARAFALRDTFADVLHGMGMVEEIRDYESIGGTGDDHDQAAKLSAELHAADVQDAEISGPENPGPDDDGPDTAGTAGAGDLDRPPGDDRGPQPCGVADPGGAAAGDGPADDAPVVDAPGQEFMFDDGADPEPDADDGPPLDWLPCIVNVMNRLGCTEQESWSAIEAWLRQWGITDIAHSHSRIQESNVLRALEGGKLTVVQTV